MQKLLHLPNSILKYTVAAILIMVPLYPKFPFLSIPGTFVAIRLEDLLLAFGTIVLLWLTIPHLFAFLKDRVTKSVALFVFIGLISLLSAVFVTQTVDWHIGFLHWARRIEYLVPLFLGMEIIRRDRTTLSFFVKILMIVLCLSFFYGLGQRYLSWPVIITQNGEYSKGIALRWTPGSHINATFAGHYDLSTFLIILLPILICAFFLLKGKLTKLILLSSTLGGLWLMVNAASRISLASYLGATTIALFFTKKYWAIPIVVVVSLVFVGFSSNLISRYTRIFEVIQMDLQSYHISVDVYAADEFTVPHKIATPTPAPLPVFEDRSTNIRLVVEWPRAIRALTKNPALGTGYSSISLATDNDYLRALGETGILGFLAFALLWITIGLEFCQKLPFKKHFTGLELAFVSAMAGGILGVFVNAVFIDVFEASKFMIIFMMLTGMAISVLRKNSNELS